MLIYLCMEWKNLASNFDVVEGGEETGRAWEQGIGNRGEGTGTSDALGDKEVSCWGGRRKWDGARASTSGTGSENVGRLGREGCEFGT